MNGVTAMCPRSLDSTPLRSHVSLAEGKRWSATTAASSLLTMLAGLSSVHAEQPSTAPSVEPATVVGSLESTFGVHPGQRRNHIKGTCAVGEFVGNQAATKVSRSGLFSGRSIPVVARFSLSGGNPDVSDAARSVRGMALEFRLPDGSRQHMTMINAPVFSAANPASFNAMILASKPDPRTGKPDPQKLRDFLASHPDAIALTKFVSSHNPPVSYANSSYFGVHTFKFIDSTGTVHPVKWRFVPRDGEKSLTDAEIKTAPHDFLEQRLIERVSRGPAQWDMVVQLGEPGDPQDNPTLQWPESRKRITAGTLTITQAMPQHGAECEKINFDPLVMADGIEPTNDPVLLFRSPAYAISFAKRLSGR